MDPSKIFQFQSLNDYGKSLLFFIELTAIVIGFLFVRKSKIGRLFIFYIFFDLVIVIIDLYLKGSDRSLSFAAKQFLNITNVLVSMVELYVYYFFFYHVLKGGKVKKSLIIFGLLYGVAVLVYLIKTFTLGLRDLRYASSMVESIEFILIIPPCFIFYHQLFTASTELPLFSRPSFWIITGIFFYALISIPTYLINNSLLGFRLRDIVGMILFYIPFAINIMFLIKSFLCRRPLMI